jgi:hypothetical protein
MAFRPEYERALILLGQAFEALRRQGFSVPVLVGGGAVEFYSAGALMSGDFDVVADNDESFDAALQSVGFQRENRPGWLQRGYFHPELAIGVEVVGRALFDGRGDRNRICVVDLGADSSVQVVSPEDLIADRMGQFSSSPQGVREMLEQAVLLLLLANEIDEAYLDKRIGEETSGTYSLKFLKDAVADYEADNPESTK